MEAGAPIDFRKAVAQQSLQPQAQAFQGQRKDLQGIHPGTSWSAACMTRGFDCLHTSTSASQAEQCSKVGGLFSDIAQHDEIERQEHAHLILILKVSVSMSNRN